MPLRHPFHRAIHREIHRPLSSPLAGGGMPDLNLILNGTFDSDSIWTKGVGFAIADGKCTRSDAATGSLLSQPITVTPGVTYRITFDILSISGGTLNTRLYVGTTVVGASVGVVGQYNTTITAGAGNTMFAIGASSGTAVFEIDNVRVEPA